MARQGINTGTSPNSGTGDSLLDAGVKINSNSLELYTLLGDGTNLAPGVVTSIAAGDNISISGSTGEVTITGLANTANVAADSLKVTGISTLNNVVIGAGSTELLVTGDARITGVLTVGTDSITIDGNAITGAGLTIDCKTGIMTVTEIQVGNDKITGTGNTFGTLTVTGVTTLTNQAQIRSDDSTPGRLDFYCESSNAHYTRVQAPPHASYSGNNTITLPVTTGTLLNTDGDGSALSGIVTQIVAGSNITLTGGPTGVVTIASSGGGGGVASTAIVLADTVVATGVITANSFKGDGSALTGLTGVAGTFGVGYASTEGDTPIVVGSGVTQLNFVGTGYTVTASGNITTVRNVAMGMTDLQFTSVSYGTTTNEGEQISYTAAANDANAKFFVESAPAGIGQIGINYSSGVMGGGQNGTAGIHTVTLRAATLFGLSEPFPVTFTISEFTLNMDNMFGAPNTFVMLTDDNDDAVFTSLSSGGLVSHDGSNYVIDRSDTNFSTATKHALYYDNTNNVLYGFRTNSSSNAIQGIFKWTSVSDASDGTTVGSGSLVTWENWADDYAVTEVSALGGTKTYNTLTLDAGTADFDGAYTRQSFKAKLDTGSASSGNALFAADSSYWWFLKDGDNSRMIIYDSVGGAWTYVYVSGANFSTAADNTAVGSPNATESQSITSAIYDGAAFQPESEYSEITYPGSVGVAAYQPGGNYTNFYGSAFAMKIASTGGLMNNFGTKASPNNGWAYGFTLEDPWLVTASANQMLAPESASDGWHNFGLSIFNISSTTYDYVSYGSNAYGPYNTGSGVNVSRPANTNNIANAGDTVQVRWDGSNYKLYINGSEVSSTTSQSTYMSSSGTTNPVLTFGDTTAQNGGTIINDYSEGNPWPFRIRDLWIANNGNISASDVAGVGTFRDRNLANWSEYSDVDIYITMNSSGITTAKGSGVVVSRKAITYS